MTLEFATAGSSGGVSGTVRDGSARGGGDEPRRAVGTGRFADPVGNDGFAIAGVVRASRGVFSAAALGFGSAGSPPGRALPAMGGAASGALFSGRITETGSVAGS